MKEPPKNVVNVDASTLILVIAAALLLPLLFAGFLFQ
jgi:hypothetical protein